MNVYEILLRAFGDRKTRRFGTFRSNGSGKFSDITDEVLNQIASLGIDAVWYAGVLAHSSKTVFTRVQECDPAPVKGECGSPFAIRDYYDVAPELADKVSYRMKEFDSLIVRTHRHRMKAIIDFVPNHVAREYHSRRNEFSPENFYLLNAPLTLPVGEGCSYIEDPARATGNDAFTPTPSVDDWYDTVKLNYGSRDTWEKMKDILMFWAEKGVDGFRCDMVEMVPCEFFAYAISEVHKLHPDVIFIAEVYKPENYRRYRDAGFSLLYDKSGMYDTLRGIIEGTKSASAISGAWQSLGDLQDNMLNFLENHDEQRIASDFVTGKVAEKAESMRTASAAKGAALLDARTQMCAAAVAALFNDASFMIYFGQEFGERGMESEGFSGVDGRTSIYDYCVVPSVKRFLAGESLPAERKALNAYGRLMKYAVSAPFCGGKSFDLQYCNPFSSSYDPSRQFAFLRSDGRKSALVVCNFGPEEVAVNVNIPALAFEYLGMVETGSLNHTRPVTLTVKPFGYSVEYLR
jgi:hypothetical protein